jgi:hypothetical protein
LKKQLLRYGPDVRLVYRTYRLRHQKKIGLLGLYCVEVEWLSWPYAVTEEVEETTPCLLELNGLSVVG